MNISASEEIGADSPSSYIPDLLSSNASSTFLSCLIFSRVRSAASRSLIPALFLIWFIEFSAPVRSELLSNAASA